MGTERDSRSHVRRQPSIGVFLGLALAISWVLGPAVVVIGGALLPGPLAGHADLLIKFGPSLAAVVAVALGGSPRESQRFRRSVTRIRIAPRWYAVAVGLPLVLAGCVVGLLPGSFSELPTLGRTFAATGAMSLVLGGGLGEELGWRGYLFPAISRRRGFTAAVLGTAAFWALWHVPMFVLGEGPGFPFGPLAVLVLAASLVLGWLYERTDGSVPVCAVAHGAINGGATALAAQVPPEALAEVLWHYSLLFAAAAVLLWVAIARWGRAVLPARSARGQSP